MIVKSFEIKRINLNKNKFILFYGKNEGLKNEAVNFLNKNMTLTFVTEFKIVIQT